MELIVFVSKEFNLLFSRSYDWINVQGISVGGGNEEMGGENKLMTMIWVIWFHHFKSVDLIFRKQFFELHIFYCTEIFIKSYKVTLYLKKKKQKKKTFLKCWESL